jgi:hypothetical protein
MPASGPCRLPEIAWRVIDGEAVVVQPRTGMVYPFNAVATRCWELADGTCTENQIAALIADEFDGPAEQISAEVSAFFEDLRLKGLVTREAAIVAEA